MFKGKSFNTFVKTELVEEGKYRACGVVVAKRSVDLKEWEERRVGIVAYGPNEEEAVGDVYLTISAILEKCKNDLFNMAESEVYVDENFGKFYSEN